MCFVHVHAVVYIDLTCVEIVFLNVHAVRVSGLPFFGPISGTPMSPKTSSYVSARATLHWWGPKSRNSIIAVCSCTHHHCHCTISLEKLMMAVQELLSTLLHALLPLESIMFLVIHFPQATVWANLPYYPNINFTYYSNICFGIE